jgi:hypothetical protein
MSKTKGIIIIRKITTMKTAGRLLSRIEVTILVVLTKVVLVVGGGGALAAEMLEEIFCIALVALFNALVALFNAFVPLVDRLEALFNAVPLADGFVS